MRRIHITRHRHRNTHRHTGTHTNYPTPLNPPLPTRTLALDVVLVLLEARELRRIHTTRHGHRHSHRRRRQTGTHTNNTLRTPPSPNTHLALNVVCDQFEARELRHIHVTRHGHRQRHRHGKRTRTHTKSLPPLSPLPTHTSPWMLSMFSWRRANSASLTHTVSACEASALACCTRTDSNSSLHARTFFCTPQTLKNAHVYTHSHTHTHTCACQLLLVCVQNCLKNHTLTNTHTHTHTHTCACQLLFA